MLKVMNLPVTEITGAIISSVVPSLDYTLDRMCSLYLGVQPLRVVPGLKSGLNIRGDDSREVGADRIVNCVSAIVNHGGKGTPMIVIDFGTATTFNIISDKDEFIIGTENSIVEHLKFEHPNKKFYPLSKGCICSDMKLTTLVDV